MGIINRLSNDKDVQRVRELEKAHLHMLQESYGIIKNTMGMTGGAGMELVDFFLVSSLPAPVTCERFECNSLPVSISVVEYHSSVTIGKVRSAGSDKYFFGLLQLRSAFPHTLIYPEGLKEKISELFLRNEVDFPEHKRFSRRFYTLCKEKEKLVNLLYNKPMNELAKYGNLEIEIKDKLCLFRHSRKPVSKTEASAICELAKDISRILT